MLNTKSFLALDFGAGSVKIAEFVPNEAGSLVLRQYGIKPLGLEGSSEAGRENALRKAITELMAEKGFSSKASNVCAPGFHVFSKFVKLPPVDTSKVTQIIQYEAQQNVPFPLEEVVWDYQILGTTAGGELEVLLVAIKSDIVEGLFRTAENTGLKLQIVDVSPAALCNAFRYNYPDLEGCSMLLDIGAKTSNLLFFEKGKVYSRGINIGANSISQEFGAEAKLRFAEAERVKIEEGFVSLGGAYEEPENPHAAAISKIARQVMTRLHIQVNQTIQFYRGQQGGSAPQRLFLAGGASVMPYTAQFFAEKLNVPVEYFNPFRNVQFDPSVNLEELAKVAHSFGELVGLGLRNVAQCPVELNLVPKSIRKRQQLDQKKPYFMAAIFSAVAVVFAYGWFYAKVGNVKAAALEDINATLAPLQANEAELQAQETAVTAARTEVDAFTEWARLRFYWGDLLQEIRTTLMRVEETMRQPGLEVGVWIEVFGTHTAGATLQIQGSSGGEEQEQRTNPYQYMDPRMIERYFPHLKGKGGVLPMPGGEEPSATTTTSTTTTSGSTNVLDTINVKFKAVNLIRGGDSSANRNLASAVEEALQGSPFMDKAGTKISELEQVDDTTTTFSFGMTLKLKQPIKN